MRTGRRLLAGIAAGGLAAGLISFTGGGVAQAAAPSAFGAPANIPAGVQVIRSDDATYKAVLGDVAGSVQAGIQATRTANGSDSVEVVYQSNVSTTPIVLTSNFAAAGSTFADLSGNNTVTLTGATGVTFQSSPGDAYTATAGGAGGTLTLNVFRDAAPGRYTMSIWSGGSRTGEQTSTIWVANPPASSAWRPSARNVVPGATANFSVMVFDPAGRPTYMKGAEKLLLSASNPLKVPVSTPVSGELNSTSINQNNAVTVWLTEPTNVSSVTDQTTARGTYTLTAAPNATLVAEGLTAATSGTVNVSAPLVTSVGWPTASRAQQGQTVAVAGAFPADSAPATFRYQICAVPATTPNLFDPGAQVTLPGGGTALTMNLQKDFALGGTTVAGTYSLSVYYRADSLSPCGTDGRPRDIDSIALTPAQSVTFGGPVATLTQTPATAAIGVGNTQTMTVTAVDAAGRRTLPTRALEGDSISYGSANAFIAALNKAEPSEADLNSGNLRYVVTGVSAGTTTVSTTSVNGAVARVSSTIGVQQSGAFTADSTVSLDQANVAEVTDPASLTDRFFEANLNVNNLVFKASGLVPGASYSWNVVGAGFNVSTASPLNGIVTADSSGNASATVAVSGLTGLAELDRYTFTLTSGTGATRVATVTYVKGYPLFASPVPNSIIFAAAGSTVSVPIVASDQYGNPVAGATVTIAGGSGAVAQGTTNTNGQLTLNVTAPASGTAAFSMTGLTPNSTQFFFDPLTPIEPNPLNFTVDTRTPVLTTVAATPSTVVVPVIDSIVNDGAEATVVTMRVNTPDGFPAAGVTVGFSGSAGVKLSATSPNSLAAGGVPVRWNGGAATANAVTNSAGIATVYAWTTKTGSNTVTGTVGTQSANQTFTAVNTTFSGRTIDIQAPSAMTTGETKVITLTVKDAFGNVVPAATPVTVQFNDGSVGTFADGTRQKTVQPDGLGQVQVTVKSDSAGEMKFKSGVFVNTSTVADQFGAAVNQLFRNSPANSAPGFAASNAPLETMITVTAAKSLVITNSGRDSRGGYFSGVSTGFAAGESVNVRFKVYNKSTKKWSAWQAGGTVTLSNNVSSQGNRSFSGVIEKNSALKVRVVKNGVNSEIVTIAAK